MVLEDHIFRYMDGIVGTVAFGNIYGTEQIGDMNHFHDMIETNMAPFMPFRVILVIE